ncbi:hypothetical protein ACWDSJ_26430 [Nocardia sp. NPDC003482]
MPAAPTQLRCSACSTSLLPTDPPSTDTLCTRCAQAPVCDGCGLPAPVPRHTVDDGQLCRDCATGWRRCRSCNLYTRHAHATVYDGAVCDGCEPDYTPCAECQLLTEEPHSVDNGSEVCESCANDFRECGNCFRLTTSASYCSTCADWCTSSRIHDYSYRPTPRFHGDGPVFLGLELEIKCPRGGLDDCAYRALDQLDGLAYLKEDGSIPYGFELVTHPMSYPYALERFPWDVLAELASRGAYVDDSVGIHVHVSRAGFGSPAHIYRWMKFVYRNESHATTLARRTSHEWATFDPDARLDIGEFAKSGKCDYGLAGLGRYQAINTLPPDTFEVRIFASSLKPQQVQAALAFVAASVDYTRTLTSADVARRRGWEWTAFVTWLRARPCYAPLLAELEDLACAS